MEKYYRIAQDVYGCSIFTDEKYTSHKEAVNAARNLFKTSITKPKEVRVSEWLEGENIGMVVWFKSKNGRKTNEVFRSGYKF